jgi:hypothetical protein
MLPLKILRRANTFLTRRFLFGEIRSKKFLLLVCFFSVLTYCGLAIGVGRLNSPYSLLSTIPRLASHKLDLGEIGDIKVYKDLPVGDVKTFTVPGSWGTVIYVPQYHQNPASTVDEQTNDSAQKAQGEIYQILAFLEKNFKTDLIMVEGELTGQIQGGKIDTVSQEIDKRNKLYSLYQNLKQSLSNESLDSQLESKIFSEIDQALSKADREIILTGAPYKLASENSSVKLYGTENSDTLEECRTIVRNYIYIQDRLAQLNNPAQNKSTLTTSATLFNAQEMDLLKLFAKNPSDRDLDQLSLLATSKNNSNLASLINSTKDAVDNLSGRDNLASFVTQGTSTRADNPYANISNKARLESLQSDSEKEIEKTVVEKRNKETAQIMAQTLRGEGKNLGILEFGAGHEDGLIKELNNQGLSVIEIEASEVVNRNAA